MYTWCILYIIGLNFFPSYDYLQMLLHFSRRLYSIYMTCASAQVVGSYSCVHVWVRTNYQFINPTRIYNNIMYRASSAVTRSAISGREKQGKPVHRPAPDAHIIICLMHDNNNYYDPSSSTQYYYIGIGILYSKYTASRRHIIGSETRLYTCIRTHRPEIGRGPLNYYSASSSLKGSGAVHFFLPSPPPLLSNRIHP